MIFESSHEFAQDAVADSTLLFERHLTSVIELFPKGTLLKGVPPRQGRQRAGGVLRGPAAHGAFGPRRAGAGWTGLGPEPNVRVVGGGSSAPCRWGGWSENGPLYCLSPPLMLPIALMLPVVQTGDLALTPLVEVMKQRADAIRVVSASSPRENAIAQWEMVHDWIERRGEPWTTMPAARLSEWLDPVGRYTFNLRRSSVGQSMSPAGAGE